MTTPAIVPSNYQKTATDYLNVKCDREGAARIYAGTVTVPSGTASTTIIGLIPFNKGARFHLDGQSVYTPDIGAASTTISLGYVYDDNVTYTNNQTAWANAATNIQSGGFVALTAGATGLQFVAAANGWLCATINTAATDTNGDISFQILGSYDGTAANNQNGQA